MTYHRPIIPPSLMARAFGLWHRGLDTREIARLECERAALVASAYRVDDAAISEIDALLAKVRALMEGKP